MPKEPLTGGGYDYVQSNAPADPKTGETWYDQSEADATKRGKIYADVGNGPEWVVVPALSQDDILADGTPFEGAKIGNLDMAVSEAGGSDTDLRFSLTPERVDATQRQTYIDNFGSNGFVNSKTAMENVSGSPTVMDTVAGSQTAMDAVAASILSRTAALSSSYAVDTIWSENYASQRIWDEGTIDGTGTVTPSWIAPTIDLSNATTLKVDTERSSYGDVNVNIDGTNIFSNGGDHTWTTRSLDVSGYNGEHTVELEWDRGYDGTSQTFIDSGTGNGVAMKFYQDGNQGTRYGNFRNLRFE